ncbi:hypothetical protein KBC40_00670 [Patescibacteria group bacterium]|nr:hypothetical protein [Patescibacteria group bacterium]
MYKNKKVFSFLSSALFLLLVGALFSQTNVFAQSYQGPNDPPPGGNVGLNFLENPLQEDLDLSTHNILDANEIHASRLIMSGNSLDITSGEAAAGEEKWAFGATANSSNDVNSYTYGLRATTIFNSGIRPSYAVYGISENNGGRAVYAKANRGYAIYGEAINNPGVYGVSTGFNSAGVFGSGANGVVGQSTSAIGSGVFGRNANGYAGGSGVFGLGANGVVGQSSLPGGAGIYGSVGSGDYAGYFDGPVLLDNGAYLYVHTTGNLTPIVAVAGYNDNNAGIQAYGKIGLYANGGVVGVYGYGEQGVLAKGARTLSTVPPPGEELDDDVTDNGIITKFFGVDKTQAAVGNYTPYTIGLVAAGGSNGGASLTHAGLGLCALSGAKDKALGDNPNYYTYCQDASNKNNYAGFFGGDIYIKDGSVQVRGQLSAANENMLYINASAVVAGSHLIKAQTLGVDKFRVDKDGNAYFAGSLASQDADLGGNLLLNGASSYIDFRGGTSGPSCKSGEEGRVYYFTNYSSLCLCQGAGGWVNLVPGLENGKCTNGVWEPS